MSKKGISKDVKGFLVMWLWKHWTCISCTHALLRASAIFEFVHKRRTMLERKTFLMYEIVIFCKNFGVLGKKKNVF